MAKKRIIVVDDSEMIRNFHCYILKTAGFQVMSAVDGADALEKIYSSEEPIDMVVTDINMPNMDGYTFIERLREDEQYEEIPIIIISTEDELKDMERGYEAGANIYIVKPTEPEVMVENVRMLME
ncbi:response regulator [Syntrophomonas wolfei]|uniref:Stage 0 sporulation protein A homolog n=2 Tax=Syntrophomonas wolfei TaxID=863 RepID=Q0AWZ1_SYNWW|nr:response regulator [Syntrophomonas wolfei]ABI68763.1 response regulator receiver protein [Syntrophomonas wolfei subsp. wolfei str. Goettingen G311]